MWQHGAPSTEIQPTGLLINNQLVIYCLQLCFAGTKQVTLHLMMNQSSSHNQLQLHDNSQEMGSLQLNHPKPVLYFNYVYLNLS